MLDKTYISAVVPKETRTWPVFTKAKPATTYYGASLFCGARKDSTKELTMTRFAHLPTTQAFSRFRDIEKQGRGTYRIALFDTPKELPGCQYPAVGFVIDLSRCRDVVIAPAASNVAVAPMSYAPVASSPKDQIERDLWDVVARHQPGAVTPKTISLIQELVKQLV